MAAGRARRIWACLSLVVAVAGTAGSLYLSLGMGLKGCPLCFYQRTLVMAALSVLAMSLWIDRDRPGLACLLVLPVVWSGLGVAVFHQRLVMTGMLERPAGILNLGAAPAQSVGMFALLALCCTLGAWLGRRESPRQGAVTVAAILAGGLMAWGCVASAPPLPPAPPQPYDPVKQPLDTCRPPYQGVQAPIDSR